MKALLRIGLSLARTRAGKYLYLFMAGKVNFRIPAFPVLETRNVVAYHHQEPSYPFHVLIVPKRNLESIMGLYETDGSLLVEIITVVKSLVEEYQLVETGYRLIVNGGRYQHIPQLHFHLIAETYPEKQ